MKKIFMYIMSIAMIASIGCSKEQSELSLDNIQSKAIVKGKATYNAGYYKENGSWNYNKKVAASNVTVRVIVDYSMYDDDASGVKYFETKTDADGNYEISIPAHKSFSAKVQTVDFYGTYSDYDLENDTTKDYEVVMENSPSSITIEPKGIVVVNLTSACSDINLYK